MTRKGLRLVSYVRVSDVRGREGPGFISPAEQREKCSAFATAMGHTIIDEAEELDRSGGDMSRPVFAAVLERIEAGEADGMIVAKLNRFARSNVGAWQALERIKQAGGELLSVEENIDTSTATGRFLRDFMLIAANWERERIGEQWLSARTRAVSRGIHVSRHVPPGYRRLPKSTDASTDRRLVPDETHAPVVAEAFALAARGDSYSTIADHLTTHRVPIGGNGRSVWQPYRIKRLLANRVYLGEARSGEGIANQEAHQPLVDVATWTLAQRQPSSEPRTSSRAVSLLAGIGRCASCSHAMRSQAARGSTVAAYRCSTTSVHGRCPGPSTISLARLDEYVLERFLAHAGEFRLRQVATADTAIDEFAQAAAEAEVSYRQALTNVDLRKRIGSADHDRMVAALHEEWQRALAEIPMAPASRPEALADVDVAGLVAELQRRGDVASLRELLGSAIQAVFVRPAASRARNLPIGDRVRVVWRDEEPLVLPRRGERFEPRAYTWN
jgi:DNA invertase Pin-like site-specific DNA recombinase